MIIKQYVEKITYKQELEILNELDRDIIKQ